MYDELTKVDIEKIEEEIRYRRCELAPKLGAELQRAREFGDLSENSEYTEAKQEQGKLHGRKAELQAMIANAKIVDESQIDWKKVSVGSIVTVHNVERNADFTYHIVGSYETDPKAGKISDSSPIGP